MSGIPGNLLLAALLLGSMFIVFFILTRGHRPAHVLAASIAGRWKGKVHAGGILSGTWVELDVQGVAGEVTFAESNYEDYRPSAGWTRVRMSWPSDRRLRVLPEGLGSKVRRLLGSTEMKFDDPFFDDRFWIESSHPVWARDVLDPVARRGLVAVSRIPDGDVTLDVGPAGIVLRTTRVLVDDPNDLRSFIELAVTVLMKARGLADALGVKLEPLRSSAGSSCPVCGHPVAESALPCARCRTPHHQDCWKYFGGCAVFACKGRGR